MLEKFAISGYENCNLDNNIGIFGNPIAHTLSPVIHDNLSLIFGFKKKYIPFLIEDSLEARVKDAYNDGILGLNITVPHKENVMSCLVDIDIDAKNIGAVNTLVRVEGGYKGYNTDMPGLARAIMSENISLEDETIVILGAGGAARAVAYMCGKYNAKRIYIINRTYKKVLSLCDDMNGFFGDHKFVPVAVDDYKTITEKNFLLIQSTSIGLHDGDGLPLIDDVGFYSKAKAGVDLIYNPAETMFIKTLSSMKIKAINGLKMLLFQGVMAYELWTEVEVDDEITENIYRKLCDKIYGNLSKENIILIGYMGSGKSTVGERLARELGYEFVDTDSYIVEREGKPITKIFEDEGEEYFRKVETDIISEITSKYSNSVISTGGGMPLKEINRKLLKNSGKVYFLDVNADIIFNRVKDNKDRPLLNVDGLYEKICNMLSVRRKSYVTGADYIVDASKSVDEIIEDIKNN